MSERLKAYSLSLLIHLPAILLVFSLSYNLERTKSNRIIEIDLSITNFEPMKEEVRKADSEKHTPKRYEAPKEVQSRVENISEPKQEQKIQPLETPYEKNYEPPYLEKTQVKVLPEPKPEQKLEHSVGGSPAESSKQDSNQQAVDSKSVKGGTAEGAPVAYKSSEETYIRENLAVITKIVQSYINYPPIARRMGWEGRVLISFVLTSSGEIRDLKVLKSCGFEILDREALEGVKKSYREFPKPSLDVLVKLPIAFKLE